MPGCIFYNAILCGRSTVSLSSDHKLDKEEFIDSVFGDSVFLKALKSRFNILKMIQKQPKHAF